MRVAVAMSGGVDSSVAAAFLQAQGHEVVGVTLQQWPRGDTEESAKHGGCCSLNAVEDALGIAFDTIPLLPEGIMDRLDKDRLDKDRLAASSRYTDSGISARGGI